VVGDRVDTDLAAAAAANLDAALVLTGGASRADVDGFEPRPVAVEETLADLLLGGR
jgi:ribonucleotide monophosphatase NagD (HAD superfamily)